MYLHIVVSSIIACGVTRLRLEGVPKFLESRSFTEYNQDPSTTHNQDPSTTHNQDPPPPSTTGDTGYWTLDTGYWGYWILNIRGYWILPSTTRETTGYWTGYWTLGIPTGYWTLGILDTGYWTPEDIGHWRVLDPGGYWTLGIPGAGCGCWVWVPDVGVRSS